jgi:AcrR family transcriptional regulator
VARTSVDVSIAPTDKQPLTQRRIIDAALARIDRDGLEELSMRKLGADLGVEGMALYRHVSDKQALIELVVDSVFSAIDLPASDEAWVKRLRVGAHELRRVALDHPNLLVHLVVDPPPTPAVQQRVDSILDAIRTATNDDELAVRHFWMYVSFVSGSLLGEVTTTRTTTTSGVTGALPVPLQCPVLARLGPQLAVCDFAAQFDSGLDLVISGIRSASRRRRT